MATIGYARVSTRDQSLDIQVEQLKAAGCAKIFHEKQSGAKSDRPALRRMIKSIEPSDVVVVSRLDRLARSTRDLLNLIHELSEAGASFKSLADAWCDTTTPHGKLILAVMGGIAEFERSLIMCRTHAGIARAREKGTPFGRPERLAASEKRKIAERYAAGATMAELAADYQCAIGTIHSALKKGAA